jgi:hypothetical protein
LIAIFELIILDLRLLVVESRCTESAMPKEKTERPSLLGSGVGEALMAQGEDREKKLEEAVGKLQAELEAAGGHIRDLVLAQTAYNIARVSLVSICARHPKPP